MGVVGAGSMGASIGHLAAQSGFEVVVVDSAARALENGRERIQGLLRRSVEKGRLSESEAEATLARMRWTEHLEEVAGCDFIVEAVIENLSVKQDVFRRLDHLCRENVVLATNTSSISITSIASVTRDPSRVAGMHFFYPPQVMKLVEVVRGYETSAETVATVKAVAARLGKETVEVKRDTPGFIVNRVMIPQFIEAIRLVEEGVATPEDVDKAVKLGLNYPMGPFELQDFTGTEIGLHVMDVFYEEFKDPRFAAPTSLRALVRAGRYGKKVNKGWYNYEDGGQR